MKTKIKIFAMLFVAGTLVMSSCNPDDKDEPLTKEEAQEVLSSTSEEMQSIAVEAMSTPGGNALMTLMMLNDMELGKNQQIVPFADLLSNPTEFDAKTLVNSFIPQMVIKAKKNTSQMGEIWTWNFETGYWDYEETAENSVIWIFPSNENQMVAQVNDAKLTISNLELLEQNADIFPISASISLTIDEVEEMSASYEASLSNNGIEEIQISVTLAPFELNASLIATSTSNSVKVVISHTLKKDGVPLSTSNIELVFEGTSVLNPFMEDDLMPSTAKGYLHMGEIKAEIDYAVAAFLGATVSATDINILVVAANEHLNMIFKTYPGGDKIGSITWDSKWDMEEEIITPLFEYNDGTTETLEEAFNFTFQL